MSSTLFGEHLKREREMRGVSLEEIAAATRISTRFLEALENGHWDQLPGGAFNRGFIRSTARFLGLDEESMVAEYALETKGQMESKTPDSSVAPMPRDLRPLGAAIGAIFLIIVGLAFGIHSYHATRLRKQAAAAAASATPARANAFSTPNVAPAGNILSPANKDSSDSAKTETPAVVPTTSDVLTLKIEDGKSARVKVVADGKTLYDGRIRAKTEKVFEAHDGFQVTSDESSALSLELNGQTMPIPDRAPGQPISLSRKDLKAFYGNH